MADDKLAKEQKEIPPAVETQEVVSDDVCSTKKFDNNTNIPQETILHPSSNDTQTQTSDQVNWHSRPLMNRPRFPRSRGYGYTNNNRQRTRRDFNNFNNQTYYTQTDMNSYVSPMGPGEYSTNYGPANVWSNRYSTGSITTNQSKSKSHCKPSSAGSVRPSEPQHYVDSFTPNFVDKPTSSSDIEQIKPKHTTSQEIPSVGQQERTGKLNPYAEAYVTRNNSYHKIPQNNPQYWSAGHYSFDYNYNSSNGFAIPFFNTPYMMRYHNSQFYPPQQPSYWYPHDYSNRTRQYHGHDGRRRQLYDPNKEKTHVTDSYQNSTNSPGQTKVKTEPVAEETTPDLRSNLLTAPSETVSIATKPITILRKKNPITETENNASNELSVKENCNEKQTSTVQEMPPETTKAESNEPVNENVSSSSIPIFPDYEILSLIQHSNGVAALNEYIQQKKMTINYEYLSVSSGMFSCVISINGQTFSCPSKANSKSEAQKLACDFVLNILYRQSCIGDESVIVLSDKHDWIAQKSVTKFQSLNVNELLLGRKTLAAILKVTDDDFSQAHVISIATGNASLDESYIQHIEDGSTLHDCHAEVLARRGLIRYFFQQIKQCDDNSQSIFTYNAATQKYQLHENVTFHMYISSTPCGLASMNISSNSLRYKQGQIEGTVHASTSSLKYPIKSCSDKICRWNILGLQGGLLIHFLETPIYLKTITVASESTFNPEQAKIILSTRLNSIIDSLPFPYRLNIPEIGCPPSKSLQIERQVSKLQSNAFAWNTTRPDQFELIEPRSGKLKNDRSTSTLSKERFFFEFMELIKKNPTDDLSLSFGTYREAKQRHELYTNVKSLISDAFLNSSGDDPVPWLSKNEHLEQFSST